MNHNFTGSEKRPALNCTLKHQISVNENGKKCRHDSSIDEPVNFNAFNSLFRLKHFDNFKCRHFTGQTGYKMISILTRKT